MWPIRVLLADDHTLVRAGIRTMLQNITAVEVIAEAGDGRDALRLIETHRPNVVLIDITVPGLIRGSVTRSKRISTYASGYPFHARK